MTNQFHNGIESCNACAQACDALLREDGTQASIQEKDSVSVLLIDCTEVCRLTSSYLFRGSEMAKAACSLCAEVCVATARACEKHQEPSYQRIAQACTFCAEDCERIARGWLGRKMDEPTGGPYAG